MDLLVDSLSLCLWPEAVLVPLWTLLGPEALKSLRVCCTSLNWEAYVSVIVQSLTLNDPPPPSWRPHIKSINYPVSWDTGVWSVLVICIRRWVRALGCRYIAKTLTCPSHGGKNNLQGTKPISSFMGIQQYHHTCPLNLQPWGGFGSYFIEAVLVFL